MQTRNIPKATIDAFKMPSLEAYETLLLDIMRGDATHCSCAPTRRKLPGPSSPLFSMFGTPFRLPTLPAIRREPGDRKALRF